MDRTIQAILLADNAWLGDRSALESWLESHLPRQFIPRESLDEAGRHWRDTGRAHLVVGPRQAGKSTAIWSYLAQCREPVLFIDCEQAAIREWCAAAPLFLSDLPGLSNEPFSLFFEEAQHLENAGLFLKGLVDRGFDQPILATGSSSFHLGARIRESLAGRATRTRLLPFSLSEVSRDLADLADIPKSAAFEQRAMRHLARGGYPEVWLSEDPDRLLTNLVESIILRDATDLYRIGRPDAFRRLLRLAAMQVGQLANYSEWASVLGISRDTVASYVEILESSHVLQVVPPFAGGRRSELTRMPKIFFIDNGIRNRLLHDFNPPSERTDAGAVVENWVFSELVKSLSIGETIHFWRSTSGAEVDFVLETGRGLRGVEVKAGRLARPSIPRSARSFLGAYKPSRFAMVSASSFPAECIGDTRIHWLRPWEIGAWIRAEREEPGKSTDKDLTLGSK